MDRAIRIRGGGVSWRLSYIPYSVVHLSTAKIVIKAARKPFSNPELQQKLIYWKAVSRKLYRNEISTQEKKLKMYVLRKTAFLEVLISRHVPATPMLPSPVLGGHPGIPLSLPQMGLMHAPTPITADGLINLSPQFMHYAPQAQRTIFSSLLVGVLLSSWLVTVRGSTMKIYECYIVFLRSLSWIRCFVGC